MQNKNQFRKIFLIMSAIGILTTNQLTFAAAFQLLEQDAISVGNYHAGAASLAEDASTGWYNPAGLVRIKNQEVIAGANFVDAHLHFKGTVGTDKLFDSESGLILAPQPVSDQGGGWNTIPFLHYAAPITDRVVFGLSTIIPFGLKTEYGTDTFARYAATLSSIQVIDITPSLGFSINDNLSLGLGFDIQRLRGEFNLMGTAVDSTLDTPSKNVMYDTGYGYHLGGLYQFTPATRLGIGYHSKVTHNMQGHSDFIGPLANNFQGGEQISNNLNSTVTLPAMTTLSLFYSLNKTWDVMSSLSYVQWNVLQNLVLKNAAGLVGDEDGIPESSNAITVVVPEHYHNAWNIAFGTHYHPSDKWIVRAGLGYDQTPSNNTDRNLQLPDSDRIAVSLGGHYQATQTIGLDAGYTHLFVINTSINNLHQTVGAHDSITDGAVHSSANVYGIQVKWDIV